MPERDRPPSSDELRARLAERQARLADLEARGIDALSHDDIAIAHGGDAEQALATATWLVSNHSAYDSRQLEPYTDTPRQRDFFAQLDQTPDDEQEDPAITTS
jgi:hypothetical protein